MAAQNPTACGARPPRELPGHDHGHEPRHKKAFANQQNALFLQSRHTEIARCGLLPTADLLLGPLGGEPVAAAGTGEGEKNRFVDMLTLILVK